MHNPAFFRGLKASAPIALAFLFSFTTVGALGPGIHLSFGQTVGMTAFVFAGPAQYLVMTLLNSSHSIVEMLISVFIINFRFALMGLGLVPFFRNVPLKKVLVAVPMLSNSTSAVTVLGAERENGFSYFLGVCAGSYPVAVLATGLGYLVAGTLPKSILATVPVLLPLYFIILLARDWKKTLSISCAATAMFATPMLHAWSPTWGRLLAIFVTSFAFYFLFPRGEKNAAE